MEEVLTSSENMLAGWLILLVQLVITLLVGVFIVRSARQELDKTIQLQSCEQTLPVKEIICQCWDAREQCPAIPTWTSPRNI